MKVKICLDPGHGGHDPGAVGAVASLPTEANLVLRICTDLRGMLEGQGHEVEMTRTTDTYLGLTQRAKIANAWGADYFLSVHCNSASSPGANGFEVFTSPGQTGADAFATDLFAEYAAAFPSHRGRQDTTDGDPDKEAHFTVLKRTMMPAALFEVEFISNTEMHKWVDRNTHQIAQALAAGVLRHVGGNPIPVPTPSPPASCACPHCGNQIKIEKA